MSQNSNLQHGKGLNPLIYTAFDKFIVCSTVDFVGTHLRETFPCHNVISDVSSSELPGNRVSTYSVNDISELTSSKLQSTQQMVFANVFQLM